MRNVILISILTAFIIQDGVAQSKKEIARNHIINLKDGVILYRLKGSIKTIEKLRSLGLDEKAEKLIEKEKHQNEFIIKAFSDYFEFCEVYFYHPENVKEIQEGHYDSLLDSNEEIISKIKGSNKYFAAYIKMPDTDFNSEAFGSVIMDPNFKVIPEPFPAYHAFKIFNLTTVELDPKFYENKNEFEIQVYDLNRKLALFYERTLKKINKKKKAKNN